MSQVFGPIIQEEDSELFSITFATGLHGAGSLWVIVKEINGMRHWDIGDYKNSA